MKSSKKKSLKGSLTLLLFILITSFFMLSSMFMFFNSKLSINETFAQTSVHHAERIGNSVDADLYAEFLKNPAKDDTYEKLRTELNEYREKIGAMYVYTLQVTDDQKLGIMVDGMASLEDTVDIGEPTTATTYKDITPVLNGNTASTEIVRDPEYGDYMSAFAPINDSNENLVGILGVDMEAEVVNTISNDVLTSSMPIFLVGSLVVLVLILLSVYFYLSKKLNPLAALTEVTKLIASGDIEKAKQQMSKIDRYSKNEIGILGASILSMTTTLESIIKNIQTHSLSVNTQSSRLNQTSNEVNEASNQIATTMEEMANAIELQANSTTDISEEMNEFSQSISLTANQGQEVLNSSTTILTRTETGTKLMNSSIDKMEDIYQMVEKSVTKVRDLESQTNEVTTLVSFISSIADQTNLLALNAAIEAARAGEAGKGFAVVADEVRKLAEEVSKSVKNINTIVSNVKNNSSEMADFLQKGLTNVVEGKENLNKTGDSFKDISFEISSMNGLVTSMHKQLQTVLTKQEQMKSALTDIAAVSEENAAAIEQVTASSQQMNASSHLIQNQVEELHEMSKELNEMNGNFRV
ncbi:methyl-accepting chemotaxis protein [Metabacillus herbersteinensis]|uniref:Methyl-accepting chemotaxis protein n=1 Tax=Metabacillus herbersteinensis TaxID=283816 RepID=A0ABV6G9S7_9BACI